MLHGDQLWDDTLNSPWPSGPGRRRSQWRWSLVCPAEPWAWNIWDLRWYKCWWGPSSWDTPHLADTRSRWDDAASFRSGAHARTTLTVMWTAGAELLLRNLEYAIVTLLKVTSGSEFALTQRKTPADVLNEAHLFLVHDDDGESHLLGPRAHHCRDGFPTGLFQTVPKILWGTTRPTSLENLTTDYAVQCTATTAVNSMSRSIFYSTPAKLSQFLVSESRSKHKLICSWAHYDIVPYGTPPTVQYALLNTATLLVMQWNFLWVLSMIVCDLASFYNTAVFRILLCMASEVNKQEFGEVLPSFKSWVVGRFLWTFICAQYYSESMFLPQHLVPLSTSPPPRSGLRQEIFKIMPELKQKKTETCVADANEKSQWIRVTGVFT